MNTHKLYANQFPYGTIVTIVIKDLNPETGEFDARKESYMVTHCDVRPHNKFIAYGRHVYANNTMGDVEVIGTNAYLERELGSMTHFVEGDGLYNQSVNAGLIVPGKGPLIKKPKSFNYQHFPEGTVFVIHKYMRPYDSKDEYPYPSRTFTAKSIVHNGVGSYCIETTTPNSEVYGDAIACGFYTINVSHVEKIIKRGDGVVSVSSAQFNGRQYKKHLHHKSPIDRECGNDAGGSKTNYTAFSVLSIINQAVAKLNLSTDQELDGDKLNLAFMMQTFVKMKPLYYAKANRKRTDRWMKQNINRFLMPIQVAKDIEDDEYQATYAYDMR